MFTFTNNFVLLSTSNNIDSFISNSNFCFCQHQFVVYSTPNSKDCLLQPTSISVFVTYFVYFFLNSLTQPFCLNFSTPISASIFVFFYNHVSQQLNNLIHFSFLQPFANKQPSNSFFFGNQPSNSIFLFFTFKHFQQFYCLISLPPCFFWIRCVVC